MVSIDSTSKLREAAGVARFRAVDPRGTTRKSQDFQQLRFVAVAIAVADVDVDENIDVDADPRACPHLVFCWPQEAGIEPGDTLQQVDGVQLGSYKEGVEIFKKLRGPVVLTVLRQNDEVMI